MDGNRISATLSPQGQAVVLASIKEKLPFLIDLSPEERRTLPKMGDKRRLIQPTRDEVGQGSRFKKWAAQCDA